MQVLLVWTASAGNYTPPNTNYFNVKVYQNKWMESEKWVKGEKEGMAGVSELLFSY